jgi:hypothetical protein
MENLEFDPRHNVIERIAFARRLFGADVHAMPHAMLAATCGGASRCGYDLIFELVGFFDTFGKLLSDGPSEVQGPSGGWARCGAEFQNKESSMAELDRAAGSFVKALEEYKGDFVRDEFPSPVGSFTPLGLGQLAVSHLMYHSGQLNYIQTIHGDEGFHWIPAAE